ncbi:GNAT family N-acetyltransferase [Cellulomonas gilvus]|uniref:GCN5-related N-acetyltransferase n=1 Tax=Cellulomonas gilvus (strain ATCC 13127 / NRRL B-14078) TaxID=593907 RepID=F7ZZU3_CELGA|nr:DUF4081 domain-containing GNAT family N-acetyltransferase [Cellulomonas gilvus]AEI12586.1 GCN5-related N-acetyltransferase [Cellulomonas gilvus ATCC 13127]
MAARRATVLERRPGARVLADVDLVAALGVCAQDPVGSVLATARLEHARTVGLRSAGGTLWGYQHAGTLVAVCWAGANMVPVVPAADPAVAGAALDAFAFLAAKQGRRCSSLVGPAPAVLGLWERLRQAWPGVREIRDDQPSMVIDHAPLRAPDPLVRRSRPEEYDTVLPACVRMFTEEVGYSPASGPHGPYETRVRSLVAQGRSFVRMEPGPDGTARVAFKAELGAIAGGVAQVQGVWVTPDRRGVRLSEHGMAAVVELARELAPVVSLYVNDYNARAIAAYRAVGFRQVGSYATVLF